MVYKCRVTLSGLKGFFRVYYLNGENSLYVFHKQLQSDLEFTQDQPILFKGLGKDGNVIGRYALVNLGAGTVDDVTIASASASGITDFVYFYDTVAKKSVNISFEGEVTESELRGKTIREPLLTESKGPVPSAFENGYVAFEDLAPEDRPGHLKRPLASEDGLPDEDDLEGEDDDESDEDGEDNEEEEELIYDENE